MATADLPSWVWDLIADLVDEDDIHPPLFTATGVQYDWCPLKTLNCIPDDALRIATHIAKYRRQVRQQ